jgi:hypothetical protein
VRRTARFHDHDRRRQLREVREELISAQPAVGLESAWPLGDGHLEDVLCDVNPNQSILHVDSSFALTGSDFGTSMPIKSQEESISSLKLTKRAFSWWARCARHLH